MTKESRLPISMFVLGVLLGITCLTGIAVHSDELAKGQVIPKVVCQSDADQSYALYLPSNYSTGRKWPILYAFDPGARGSVPVERFKVAAEKVGFIVVGSNNSRNGPWEPTLNAIKAVVKDTQTRFSIDETRIYATGLSGGARVSCTFG